MQDKDDDSHAVSELLEHRRNHERAITRRVRGNEEEGDLPRQREACKSVKESGVSDRRGISAANEIEHEVERRNDQQAPNACDAESDFRESHERNLLGAKEDGFTLEHFDGKEKGDGGVEAGGKEDEGDEVPVVGAGDEFFTKETYVENGDK